MQPYLPYQQSKSFQQTPQQPRFAQGPPPVRVQWNTPTQNAPQVNHNQRAMYKSTIQATSTSFAPKGGLGLSKLESMGRTIKEESVESQHMRTANQFGNQNTTETVQNRNDRPQRARMAASVIYFNKNTEGSSSFGGFNNSLQTPQNNSGSKGLGGLEFLASKARTVQEE